MIWAVLLLQAAAASVPAASQGDRDVTVTGRRLASSADALAACIAQRCPPERDIALSMAQSGDRMLAGDYEAARGILLRAERSNVGYAARYPVQVASLISMEAQLTTLTGKPARPGLRKSKR